jgi:hypothetical protein
MLLDRVVEYPYFYYIYRSFILENKAYIANFLQFHFFLFLHINLGVKI